MRINVAGQLKSPLGDRRDYHIDEETPEGLPIKGEVALVRTHRSILVTGKFNTLVKSTCVRCLEEFNQPVELAIEEEFFPARDFSTDMPKSADSDTDSFTIDPDNTLDLSEAVRQGTELNLPVKPVCQIDCAGLCPQCGCNLNNNPCHCSEGPADPRWSPLREMFSK